VGEARWLLGWVERSDTQQKKVNTVGGSPTANQLRGVWPRTPITFFVRPKKVIQEMPPRFAALRVPSIIHKQAGLRDIVLA